MYGNRNDGDLAQLRKSLWKSIRCVESGVLWSKNLFYGFVDYTICYVFLWRFLGSLRTYYKSLTYCPQHPYSCGASDLCLFQECQISPSKNATVTSFWANYFELIIRLTIIPANQSVYHVLVASTLHARPIFQFVEITEQFTKNYL